MDDILSMSLLKELNRLPERKEKGSPHNLIRAIAAGFILEGDTVEQAVVKALDIIGFWDSRFNTDSFKNK
jgi:hypothetical protein